MSMFNEISSEQQALTDKENEVTFRSANQVFYHILDIMMIQTASQQMACQNSDTHIPLFMLIR